MPLYLIRHSKSFSNVQPEILKQIPDFKVEIDPQFKKETARHFEETFIENKRIGLTKDNKVFILTSPFVRTLQTAEILRQVLISHQIAIPFIVSNALICERNLGFFHKNLPIDYSTEFPLQQASYDRAIEDDTQFFEYPAGGESPQELLTRLAIFYANPFVKECLCSPEKHLAIITHSAVLNLSRILLEKRSPLELESLGAPPNGAIHKYFQDLKFETFFDKNNISNADWMIWPVKFEEFNPKF